MADDKVKSMLAGLYAEAEMEYTVLVTGYRPVDFTGNEGHVKGTNVALGVCTVDPEKPEQGFLCEIGWAPGEDGAGLSEAPAFYKAKGRIEAKKGNQKKLVLRDFRLFAMVQAVPVVTQEPIKRSA